MKDKLRNYLTCNMDKTLDIVLELNSWNRCLDYLEFIPMELFDECLEYHTPTEIANMIHFGENFTPHSDYFSFNGYMNLVGWDESEVNHELTNNIDEIIDCLLENKDNISIPEEVENILNSELL